MSRGDAKKLQAKCKSLMLWKSTGKRQGNGKQERRYLVNTRLCPRYTDDLEQQIYNKQGEPDKEHDQDHTPDAGGYYIAYSYPINKPISNVNVAFGRH